MIFELNGKKVSLADLQNYATQNNIDFETYMNNMRELGMVEVKDIPGPTLVDEDAEVKKGPVLFEERDVLDRVKSKIANFVKMPLNAVDNFIQIYETGEYPGTYENPVVNNLVDLAFEFGIFESPFEGALGYASSYLRGKGYDIPERAMGMD